MKSNKEKSSGKFGKNDLKDLEFVDRVKSGDRNAYEHIYKRYFKFILQKCYMSIKDQQMAKDMATEIMMKVYLNIDKYTVDYTFNSWVWSIANNFIVDHARKSKREPVNMNHNIHISNSDSKKDEDSNVNVIYSGEIDSKEMNPEQLMQYKHVCNSRKKFVQDLLSSLNERERMIMVHYYFDDMSYDEIAKKLNIGLSSMKVTLMRTKEKLKNRIGDYSNITSLLAA